MIKPSTKQLQEISKQAIEFIKPYLTTIVGVRKNPKMPRKYIGTGAFVKYDGHTYIFSAMHVANNIPKYNYLFHGVGPKEFPIQGHWVATAVPNADFGVMGCFEEALTDSEKLLEFDEAKFQSNHSKDAYYLVMGFPAKLHTVFDFINEQQYVLYPMITKLKGIHANKDGHKMLFELSYSKENVQPPGMSGSPVWNLNLHLCESIEEWSVDKITFAGVITRWDEKTQSILGTDSELIKQVLPTITKKFRELYPREDK